MAARIALALLILLGLAACAAGNKSVQRQTLLDADSIPQHAVFAFRTNQNDRVVFRGAIDQAATGSSTGWGMLYPAPDVVSFIAAVGAHAALSSGHQAKQLAQQQAAADAVLEPYRPTLDRISHRQLLEIATTKKSYRHATRIIEADAVDTDAWIVQTAPVFAMTQDRSSIVLDTAIQVFSPNDRERPAYQNIVRVVSMPQHGADLESMWLENDGAALKGTLENQFLRSLDLAILDVTTDPMSREGYRTVRYRMGTANRVERGQVLREECGEVILRTLRGWVMSVPSGVDPSECPIGSGETVQDPEHPV